MIFRLPLIKLKIIVRSRDLEKHNQNLLTKSNHLKDCMALLFLMSFNTAQRASTCVSVLCDDINVVMDPQAPEKVKFIQLTFNKMKGVREDANILNQFHHLLHHLTINHLHNYLDRHHYHLH
jgi:hypothetical protein